MVAWSYCKNDIRARYPFCQLSCTAPHFFPFPSRPNFTTLLWTSDSTATAVSVCSAQSDVQRSQDSPKMKNPKLLYRVLASIFIRENPRTRLTHTRKINR